MTTPSQELRTAAAKLRAIAAHTTPGPWTALPDGPPGGWTVTHADTSHGDHLSEPDARYTAAMHPGVGTAIAKWLESLDGIDVSEHGPLPAEYEHALAVARQILGSQP